MATDREASVTPAACIDRVLPDQDRIRAAELASAERTTNRPPGGAPAASSTPEERFRMAVETRKLWRPGRTLRVQIAPHARCGP